MSLTFRLSYQRSVSISILPHKCHIPCPPLPPQTRWQHKSCFLSSRHFLENKSGSARTVNLGYDFGCDGLSSFPGRITVLSTQCLPRLHWKVTDIGFLRHSLILIFPGVCHLDKIMSVHNGHSVLAGFKNRVREYSSQSHEYRTCTVIWHHLLQTDAHETSQHDHAITYVWWKWTTYVLSIIQRHVRFLISLITSHRYHMTFGWSCFWCRMWDRLPASTVIRETAGLRRLWSFKQQMFRPVLGDRAYA